MFTTSSIAEMHRQFEAGVLDPLHVVEKSIANYYLLNSKFHAWVCFDPELLIRGARDLKESLSKKKPLRLLDGIPVGVKDVFNTIEFPTEMGSQLWQGFTPGNDARIVYYLKNAGGLVAGKTVTAEFAVHALNETLNPHNIEVTPGTSSSGSAVAISLGMVPMTIGTQTAGSIIRPASFCGVYGFKPSFGLLPRTGSLKTTDSLDTVGFFVANPKDLRRGFDALRVHGPNFPISHKLLKDTSRQIKPKDRPWKIALARTHTWGEADAYAKSALLEFAKKLSLVSGVRVSELELPSEFYRSHEIHEIIYGKSLAYYFSEEQRQSGRISPIMNEMILKGNKITAEDYYLALQIQDALIDKIDRVMSEYDACICLSTSGVAPLRNVMEKRDPSLIWTLTHLPALNVPAFISPDGLPFGLQVVSRKYNDYLMLDFVEFLRTINLIPKGPFPEVP